MSFTGDGDPVVVWQENNASAIGFAIRLDGSWTVDSIMIAGSNLFSPDVVGGSGPEAHIAFSSSNAGSGSDIMYVRWTGTTLSPSSNLTSAGQGPDDNDRSPAIAVGADGVTVMYTFTETELGTDPRELRAVSFTDPLTLAAPEVVLAASRDCSQPRSRGGADGSIHAVVVCADRNEAVYLTNRSGAYNSQSADIGSTTITAPDIDIAANNAPHIVVQGTVPCPKGSCSEPLYSVNLSRALSVSGGNDSYFSPAIALDAFDRPIIVFFDLPMRKLYWSFRDGAGFFRPQLVAPMGGKLAGTGARDPSSGLPWFIIEERNASPGVWLAKLVP